MSEPQSSKIDCYAVLKSGTNFKPWSYEPRPLGDENVLIEIAYCGICHTDLHMAKNELGMSEYPLVPGHEIVGHIRKVGSNVSKFKVGDLVGVGYICHSCLRCDLCKGHHEQYCDQVVQTAGDKLPDGNRTYGGFAKAIVVHQHFVLQIPTNLDPAAAAPLLCAGITTYNPLKAAGVKSGSKVAVVGLGGLGHIAVKLAVAMGAEVTVISRTNDKQSEAINTLKAHHFIVSEDATQMKEAEQSMDFVLDTVAYKHDIMKNIKLIRPMGKFALIGAAPEPHELHAPPLLMAGITIISSMIGGMKLTQELLDFAGKHNVVAEAEIVSIKDLQKTFNRLEKSDVRYRFVIDMKSFDGELGDELEESKSKILKRDESK